MKGNLIFGIVAKNEPESAARLRCPLDKERAGLVSGAMHGLLALPRAPAPAPHVFANTFFPAQGASQKFPPPRVLPKFTTPRVRFIPRRAPTAYPLFPQKSRSPPRPTAYPLSKTHLKIFPRRAYPCRATRVPPHKSRAPHARHSSQIPRRAPTQGAPQNTPPRATALGNTGSATQKSRPRATAQLPPQRISLQQKTERPLLAGVP